MKMQKAVLWSVLPLFWLTVGSALAVDANGTSDAQTGPESNPEKSTQLEQIVVNAQRRQENLQNVPITIEVFTNAQAKNDVITSVADIGLVTPGFISGEQAGYFQPHLRGVGTTAPSPSIENPVATYVDGVYYGAQAGSLFQLAGIDRVEVDKGPQGTLFGRNATGGLIQIITKNPEQEFSGIASLTAGNYQTLGGSVYMTGGITPNLASNISVFYQNQEEGWGRNLYNGEDVNKFQYLAVRQKTLYTPSDLDSILVALDYEQNHTSPVLIPAPGTTPLGGPPYTGSPWGADGLATPFVDTKQGGASIKIDHNFGFATLESLSAYLRSDVNLGIDGTLVVDPAFLLNIIQLDEHIQVTQEFSLRSNPGSSITWTAGVYWYDGHSQYIPFGLTGGLLYPLTSFDSYSNARDQAIAVYSQATKEILFATRLTLGFRETIENKTLSLYQYGAFSGGPPELFGDAVDQKNHTHEPTWRIAIDHNITPDELLYLSYNRGYKSGGFDDVQLPVRTYQPETLDAYEVGSKTELWNRRFELNTAAFYYNYRNVQTVAYPAGSELIYSAPKAKIYGVDLDLKAIPFDSFTLSGGFEFLHATYTDFPDAQISTPAPGGGSNLTYGDAAGNRLPMAPQWTFNISPMYVIPLGSAGDLSLSAVYSYTDPFFYEPDNRLRQPAYGLLNASVAWASADKANNVRLWGKNLQNTPYTSGMYAQTNGDYAVFAAPRTFGVTFSRQF